MTGSSSTPETATAVLVNAARAIGGVIYSWDHAEYLLDVLSCAGFTVVSGGEGLQHGARIERGRPDFWDVEQRPVYRVASGAAPGTTRAETSAEYAAAEVNTIASAAPGTTAEPAPAAFVATDLTYCITHRCLGHDDGRAWTACRFGQLFYEEAATAGATAPETTPACDECDGTGTVHVRFGVHDYQPQDCALCAGSEVAETTEDGR